MRAPALRPRFEQLADHPWLVGDPAMPGAKLARRARWSTVVAIVLANATGAVVVASFAVWGLPKPDVSGDGIVVTNIAAAGAYLLFALVVGVIWGRRRLEAGAHGMRGWLEADRDPTPAERRRVLRGPLRITVVQIVLWGVAVVAFALLNLRYSGLLALGVGLTVGLGGLTTSAAVFLLCELALRPVAARALARGAEDRVRVPGVATRWILAWALGTGVPVLGMLLVAIVALTSVDIGEDTLAITMLALGGIALVFGAVVAVLAAYATVHPIRSIRAGLTRVRRGELDDAEVGVWDTTEMGLLQAGFNDMVAGLREREQIRDLFGRQVGEEVAERALSEQTKLGGEVREVSVLFVDLVGSTALAAERDPEEVVRLLNRFFAVVVDVVESCGGWINKFQGDAALAIFGAPLPVEDSATCALKAARRLTERLRDEVPELQAGIGVATGEAVAGNIGAESRFEYTVIGDPVNEAARLTDLAKEHDPPVLASAAAVDAAGADEATHWNLGDEVTLRGRAEPTRLARP